MTPKKARALKKAVAPVDLTACLGVYSRSRLK
jgi:hypothetical protein